MAERYKLPDALGGGEYEGSIEERLAGVIRLNFNGRAIYVPLDMLTPVKPPTPEEPEPGAYDIGGTLCYREYDPRDRTDNWRISGVYDSWFTWQRLWDRIGGPDVTITRLVAERVETVPLPWTFTDIDGDRVRVTALGHVEFNGSVCVQMTAGARAEMAAALLTASRAES